MRNTWRWAGPALVMTSVTPALTAPLRPRFEPTDLELLDPGTLGLDHQTAVTYGHRTWGTRYIASDFELNLGLRPNIELDVDGAFLLDRTLAKSQWMGDPLWTSIKLGLFDWHPRGRSRAVALGLQLGPRFPTWRTGHGIGYAAIGLLGIMPGTSKIVVNAGYTIDPGASIGAGRPSAFLFGLDLNQPLDARQHFALLGELGAVLYTSHDTNEYDASLGLAWDPSDHLELSLVVLGGQLASGDRLQVLLGVSPTIDIW